MENLKSGSLEIALSKSGNKTSVAWIGQSDEANPGLILNPYLDSLVEKLKGGEVVIDFAKLDYMNSSTVPPIIRFIKNLDKTGITTTITYDEKSKWQVSSFKVLEPLALMMTNISIEGR